MSFYRGVFYCRRFPLQTCSGAGLQPFQYSLKKERYLHFLCIHNHAISVDTHRPQWAPCLYNEPRRATDAKGQHCAGVQALCLLLKRANERPRAAKRHVPFFQSREPGQRLPTGQAGQNGRQLPRGSAAKRYALSLFVSSVVRAPFLGWVRFPHRWFPITARACACAPAPEPNYL